MNENFVYRYGDNLYVNLTNKCCNACTFCIREQGDGIGDSGDLWLSREPSAREVIDLIAASKDYNEVVFCGYGEPTYRVDAIVEIAAFCRGKGKRTRLNTNGLGSLINRRNVAPELAAALDVISVSLNADNADAYDRMCRSEFGTAAFSAMLDFTRECVRAGAETVLTVVAVEGVDIEKCRAVAAETGARLRVREYIP